MSDDNEMREYLKLEMCVNCAFFFAEGHEISEDTYGLCLQEYDDSLEPYMDDIINGRITRECRKLFDKYKIVGNHSCSDFKSSMPEEQGEVLPEPTTSEEALSMIIDNIDWSKQSVEKYKSALASSSVDEQKNAISSLGGLVAMDNSAAFEMLFDFLMKLVPPQNTDTAKLMVNILRKLHPYQNREKLIEPLVNTLFQTESNQQTRGWYTAVFKFLGECDLEDTEEYFIKMKDSDHFSYRIKKKIDNIIIRESRFF